VGKNQSVGKHSPRSGSVHIVHPNFHPLIILQISQGEYTLFSANFFDGFRAFIKSSANP